MGKGIFFFIAATVVGGSMMMMQARQTSIATDGRQAEQQAKVLAREIARSAYNSISTQARELEEKDMTLEAIQAKVGGPDNTAKGSYQGGTYEAWIQIIQGATYRVSANGAYGDAFYEINGSRLRGNTLLADKALCPNGCILKGRFIDSQAGYCSGVYLDQTWADTPEDEQPEPKLLFTPGNDRDGSEATFTELVPAGTQMNFLLAVHAKSDNCGAGSGNDQRGEKLDINDPFYHHVRPALVEDTEDLEKIEEGLWAMTEPNKDPNKEGIWRIAFEDRPNRYKSGGDWIEFTRDKLLDIKINGYPDRNENGQPDDKNDVYWDGETYGGPGADQWTRNADGYLEMEDYSDLPDFSDQVFEVELIDYEEAIDQGIVDEGYASN